MAGTTMEVLKPSNFYHPIHLNSQFSNNNIQLSSFFSHSIHKPSILQWKPRFNSSPIRAAISLSYSVNDGKSKLSGIKLKCAKPVRSFAAKIFLPLGPPGVISVKPHTRLHSVDNDDSASNFQGNFVSKSTNGSALLFPRGTKHWFVLVDKPSGGVSSKANAVNFYVSLLTKVLGNEQDAQMCLYHVSWVSNLGFCCALDEEPAQKLAAVPGVLCVWQDEDFESKHKDYEGGRLSSNTPDLMQTTEFSKTKLFITGLSFYTSEKTLRAAFEPFGELVEVKVIMDKISKRSRGYAFVEYSTEEAASKALQEMNGKIINGWMIVVDRAKNTPRYRRGRSRPTSVQNR